MLRHKELLDPVRRTRDMETTEFTKYVGISEAQEAEGVPTDGKKIERIRDDFYGTHANIPTEKLNEMWAFIEPKVVKNAGLTEFILDYGGAESDFFFPWLKSVFTSPSEALEMSYGAGYDLLGEWVLRVPESDNIDFFVKNDPTFVYNRERQLFVADLVTSVQDFAKARGGKSLVIDLGAGRLAWANWHNFTFRPSVQRILAFDKDETIIPEKLFQHPLSELGLSYVKADLMSVLAHPTFKDADLIMLGGVATYFPFEMFAQAVIRPVYGLLREGGVFYFDLQMDCPYLRRSMKIFDWPEMNLKTSAAETIAMVEEVRKRFWKEDMKFGVEYTLDTYNEVPTATMATFTKL